MLELPTLNESSITAGRRVFPKSGNSASRFWPIATSLGMLLARAIHSFQPTIIPRTSSMMIPTSSASSASSDSELDVSANIAGLFVDASDEVLHDFLQSSDRWQVHQQCNEPANVPLLDRKIDVEKQHKVVPRRSSLEFEHFRTVTPNHRG